jgi:hypothetical protein
MHSIGRTEGEMQRLKELCELEGSGILVQDEVHAPANANASSTASRYTTTNTKQPAVIQMTPLRNQRILTMAEDQI